MVDRLFLGVTPTIYCIVHYLQNSSCFWTSLECSCILMRSRLQKKKKKQVFVEGVKQIYVDLFTFM